MTEPPVFIIIIIDITPLDNPSHVFLDIIKTWKAREESNLSIG